MVREDAAAIVAEREAGGPFVSLLDFALRLPIHRSRLENLILCGAFDRIEPVRRGLLFALDETLGTALHLRRAHAAGGRFDFGITTELATPTADIPDFDAWDRFLWTWRVTGVCAENHAFVHLRENLTKQGVRTCNDVLSQDDGKYVTVAGMNIRPHRPPTRSGNPVLFTSLEDETDLLQVICVGRALRRCTATLLLSPAVLVEGTIERRGKGATLKVERAEPLPIDRFRGRLHPSVSRAAADIRPAPQTTKGMPVSASLSTLA